MIGYFRKTFATSRRSKSVKDGIMCILKRLAATNFDRRPIGDLCKTSRDFCNLSVSVIFLARHFTCLKGHTRYDPNVLALSRGIFEKRAMHHSNEQALTIIMMLVVYRCTVSFNNYSTIYVVHFIQLTCFHVIEL